MSRPAIVIIAWNRPRSLERILGSLSKAHFSASDVPLVIGIDGGGDPEVVKIAEAFSWNHGPKEIIVQPQRIGLKAHVLACGDLSQRFGAVTILEDDLLLSPWFYKYAESALEFYQEDDRIGGISLYSHRMMESNSFYPFEPVCGDQGVYFIQYAVSWGQVWTARQWQLFRDWYAQNPVADNGVAHYLSRWPDDSWKKEFVRYLMQTDRYFVCPGVSYSTNFADAGAHFPEDSSVFQVPLAMQKPRTEFRSFSPKEECYDPCFEPQLSWLQSLLPDLEGLSIEVDLMGQKEPEHCRTEFMLTSRAVKKNTRSWGMRMRPLWQNLHFGVEGEDLNLCRREDVLPLSEKDRLEMYIRLHRFFYPVPKLRSQVFFEFLRGIGMMKK